MSKSAPTETYLSGFCSGGAEWAHARCPAHWKDKPCRCDCHVRPIGLTVSDVIDLLTALREEYAMGEAELTLAGRGFVGVATSVDVVDGPGPVLEVSRVLA